MVVCLTWYLNAASMWKECIHKICNCHLLICDPKICLLSCLSEIFILTAAVVQFSFWLAYLILKSYQLESNTFQQTSIFYFKQIKELDEILFNSNPSFHQIIKLGGLRSLYPIFLWFEILHFPLHYWFVKKWTLWVLFWSV